MNAAKVTKPVKDEFHLLHDQMLDQLSALHCVVETIEGTDWEGSEELSAALSLLENTHKALTELYDGLASWANKVQPKVQPYDHPRLQGVRS